MFEEPKRPVDLEQLEEEKIAQVPYLPKVAIVIDDMGYHDSYPNEGSVSQRKRCIDSRYLHPSLGLLNKVPLICVNA